MNAVPDYIVDLKMLPVASVPVDGYQQRPRRLPVRNVVKACTVTWLVKQSASSVVLITFLIVQGNNLARTAVQESTLLKKVRRRAKSVELASMALEMAVLSVLQDGIAQI